MKNWKKILQTLKELETHKEFYQKSLNRVSVDPTPENVNVFWTDAKVMNDAEHKLYRLSKGD